MDLTISLTAVGKIGQVASYLKNQEGQQQSLFKGQILEGLVSRKTNEGKFVLNLGGKQFIASTKIPLQPGQRLNVQVVSTSPQITLKTLSDSLTQNIGKSLHLLDHQSNFLPLLQSLSQKIKESPLISSGAKNILNLFTQILGQKSPEMIHQDQLKVIMQRTGMDFEQLLVNGDRKQAFSTLKSALFEIISKFGGNEKIMEEAGQLIKTIELYQTLNLRMHNDSLFLFPLPLPFLDQGFFIINPDQDDLNGQERADLGKKYSLHLKLKGLGNLQIDIYQKKDTVSLQFFAQDAERAGFLKELENELNEWLTALQLKSVSFLTGAEDPIKHLMTKLSQGQPGVLDMRA